METFGYVWIEFDEAGIVLTKALLFEVLSKHITTGLLQTNSFSLVEGVVKYYSSRFYLSGTIYDEL